MATFTTITGGGARLASAGSSWVGGTAPDFTGAAKDVIVVAVGTTLTQDVDARLGNKGAAAGHAFRVNGSSASSFGEYVVPAGVTVTLAGFDTGSNTLGFTQQFARFTVQDGATVKYDLAPGRTSCLDLRGITDIDAATFDAAAGMLSWGNAGSGSATNISGQYDRDNNIQCYDLGKRWLSNAGATALGTSEDSSVAFTGVSPAGLFATRVASIEACDAPGKFYVDHEVGLVYFRNTAAFSFTATYKYLTFPDVTIKAVQNTSHNELTVDGATFNYWGANGAAEEYLLNVQNKRCATLAADRRLFRATNVTFNFCKRLCGLKLVVGTAEDMIVLSGWRVRAYADGNNLGPVLSLYRTNTSYVKFSNCSGNGFEHPWFCRFTTTSVHDNLLFEHQAWESVGLFEAGGTSANPLLVTYPDSTIDGVFHRGVGSAINTSIDNRAVSGFGGTVGRPTRLTNSVFWRSMRWLNLASYQSVTDSVLGHTYHHGINGPATLSDVHIQGVEVRRHLNVECDNGGFVELGYNRRQFFDGAVIEHCTVYHNRAGNIGTINGAFTFGDLGDNFGPQLVTGLTFRSNLISACGTGVRRGVDIAGNMLRLGIDAADYNCVHGSTAADFAGNFARFATFTHAGGIEYNTDASRSCLGLTLHNPSNPAPVGESPGRTLELTRISATNRTVAWGGGAAQQLVQDSGTATGGANAGRSGTLSDTTKVWATSQASALTPIGRWVEIVTGTGAGQVRRITNATATSLTVVPAWTTIPDATSTYVLIRSEILALTDGTRTVDVGVDARSLPTTSAMDTGIGTSLRGVSVDPAFTAPTRDLRSWDVAQGGPGTETHAVALLRATPTLVKSSLYPYLMGGFAPTAEALRNAAHDGTAIGAVPMAPAPAPTIALSPTSLAFSATAGGAAPASQTVSITNTGTGTLDHLSRSITYGSGDGWLAASFVGGTTAPTTLEVTADQTGLAAGTYTATIAVSSAAAGVTNSPQTVEVTFTVAPAPAPSIVLDPTSLSFAGTVGAGAPEAQFVAVTNGGTGTLDGLSEFITYGSGSGWLSASFVGGTTAPTSLQVSVNPAGLTAGTYTATVTVASTASGVTNSPQTVDVTFTLAAAPAPTISLDPTSLSFEATAGGAAPAAQSVAITNTGTGTLDGLARTITYGTGAGWLSASFVGGTTAPTSLSVSVDPTGLAAGTYTATIAVSSTASGVTNSPQNVDVSFTVVAAPAPTITLDPTSLSFEGTAGGGAPVAQSVAVTNTGTGTLDQLAHAIDYGGGPTGWLSAAFVGGTTAPTALDVSVDTTGLPAGVYTATIEVSSTASGVTNSPQTVDVTLTLVAAPAPTIVLDPTALSFEAPLGGAAPAAQSVAITNGGTGTLDGLARSITYASGDGWLSAAFVGGTTAPTTLEVTVDPTGLAIGTYGATIAVSATASGVTNSPQLVEVSFAVVGAPAIALDPTSLAFEATAGGAAPAAQSVAVTNAGTGTLDGLARSIDYGGGPTGWLSAAFVGGTTAPTSLEVTVDPTGLAVGSYSATIEVSSGAPWVTNSPQTIDVSLTVVPAPAPTITLAPSGLAFEGTAAGAAPAAQSVAITNTGTGTLDGLAREITYGSGDGWLTATLVGGTTAPTSLEVAVDTTGLAAGVYTATIAVSSTASGVTNSPQLVDVSLTLAPAPAPTIALSPSGLAFDATAGGAAPGAQSVAITNTGTGTLDQLARSIAYASGDGWLAAAFVGGTTAPTTLEVSVDPTGLAAGVYSATIAVSSAAAGVTNSPQTIEVTLTLVAAPAPTITLAPTGLAFEATAGGAPAAAQSVAITNTGTGTLDGLARAIAYASGDGWLTASFVGGTAAPTSLEVTADQTGLAAGTYAATIEVSSTASGVTNSPQTVDVTFTVVAAPAPTITLAPTGLSFEATAGGAAPASQSVAVTNTGTGTLDQLARSIVYGSGDGWLSASFVGGTTAPTTLEVSADPAGLTAGVYTATIAVSSTASGVTNSPQLVHVSLTVAAPVAPTILLTPSGLSFSATAGGAPPAAQTVAVTNAGAGTLDGLVAGWLAVSFVGGTTAPTSLQVTADPTGLTPGVYTMAVTVASASAGVANSPQLLDVSFTIAAPAPTIALDPTTLSFEATAGGAPPASQSVAITNAGTGTLDGLARSITYGSGGTGWLTATFVGGTTAPTSLALSVDTTGLAAGVYEATVSVSSTAGGVTNSPQTVAVSLTVAPAPAPTIALDPTTLTFEATAGGSAPAAQSIAVTNAGTGTLDGLAREITYGSGDGWLAAVFVGGATAPTSLDVTVDPTGLAEGTYAATIAVSSTATGVTNSPQTAEVSLTILPP